MNLLQRHRGSRSSAVYACLAAMALLFAFAAPSSAAENPFGTQFAADRRIEDEEVRRIVERAMAAVALAEAQATRKVAEMQITLHDRDSENRRLKAQVQQLSDSLQRISGLGDSREVEVLALRRENAALRDKVERLGDDVARLSRELNQTTATLAGAQTVIDDLTAERSVDAAADSVAALSAVANRLRRENEELRLRIDSLHTQSSLQEQALVDRPAAVDEPERIRLRAAVDEAESRALSSERSANDLRIQLMNAREELNRMRSLTSGPGPVPTLMRERDELKRRVGELEARLANAGSSDTAAVDALRRRLAVLDADSRAQAQEIASLRGRLAANEREIISLRQAIARAPSAQAPVTPPASVIRPPVVTPSPAAPAASVDINRADFDTLAAIAEIGEGRARALIWYRENVGPIRTTNDLKSVPGFNDERVETLQKYFNLEVPQ